jgi:transporter family-2 protein
MLLIAILFALAAGAANPFQSGTNAELNKQLGQPLVAGLWVYVSGLCALLLIGTLVMATRQAPVVTLGRTAHGLSNVPWWAWLGGVISIGPTLAGLIFAQRLGSGMFTSLSITASLVVSVLLDQFGLIGFRQHSASPARIAGCVLLVAGVWLVSRS